MILLFVFLLAISCSDNKNGISITLKNAPEDAELCRIEGEKLIFIDSLMFEGEKLNFSLHDNIFGLYRLILDNNNWIDIVCVHLALPRSKNIGGGPGIKCASLPGQPTCDQAIVRRTAASTSPTVGM